MRTSHLKVHAIDIAAIDKQRGRERQQLDDANVAASDLQTVSRAPAVILSARSLPLRSPSPRARKDAAVATMEVVVDSQKKAACYLSSNKFQNSTQGYSTSTTATRHRHNSTQNFIHESISSSLDFPTYIPWQTLSTDVSDKLRNGSVKINRR